MVDLTEKVSFEIGFEWRKVQVVILGWEASSSTGGGLQLRKFYPCKLSTWKVERQSSWHNWTLVNAQASNSYLVLFLMSFYHSCLLQNSQPPLYRLPGPSKLASYMREESGQDPRVPLPMPNQETLDIVSTRLPFVPVQFFSLKSIVWNMNKL